MNEITVDELWEYFAEHRASLLSNYHRIASNVEDGIEIYLTEEHGFPFFVVECDGERVFETQTISALDAETTYEDLLTKYILPEVPTESADEYQIEDDQDCTDQDEDRVDEIECAAEDFLLVLLEQHPEDCGLDSTDIDEIVSMVEQHLFDRFGISVYHPVDVDGCTIRYPFGDPDEDDGQQKLPM